MKKKLDKELIISFGTLALLFAMGIIFFILYVFNIDVSSHITGIVGSYSGLSGGIWLFLLCRNC
ncbi:hypothetical protein [Pseudobutyrivibrio xylanivorans]|uniref:Uncharacterized protein n=1 Tax=Pseudobutyrivibrio xylanivorans TaxID=185007 RepID=A0A5P6VMA0_PSEXY|nr:hypothetical protein [Pseudobutyrivibrio xylanivorans]QFJ53488.1 hypothetical protein FXF36_00670 [Pseudobutyrivibrio xylanivorans]